MAKNLNLLNKKFSRLTVVSYEGHDKHHKSIWKCLCSCGNYIVCEGSSLVSGNTKSCSCLQKEQSAERQFKHGCSKYKVEFIIWCNMRRRCNNPEIKAYKDYGGRGIKVCKRWLNNFGYFIKDMGLRPSKNHTLDRINNNGDYKPSNCRWATLDVQSRNKRTNIWLEYDGLKMVQSDWSKKWGLSDGVLNYHLKTHKFSDIYNYYENGVKLKWGLNNNQKWVKNKYDNGMSVLEISKLKNVNTNSIYRTIARINKITNI